MRYATIYGLCDPNGDIRYVGKSIEPKRRLYVHRSSHNRKKGTPVYDWIFSLSQEGLKPEMVVLEIVREDRWEEAERKWIAKLRKEGAGLLNIVDGGSIGPAFCGSQNGHSVLDENSVAEIKQHLCDGEYITVLARDFGVSITTIFNIKKNNTWIHVPWLSEFVDKGYRNNPARGSKHGNSKLTEGDVRQIKGRLRTEPCSTIARDYGVTEQAIHSIRAGKTWRHV